MTRQLRLEDIPKYEEFYRYISKFSDKEMEAILNIMRGVNIMRTIYENNNSEPA